MLANRNPDRCHPPTAHFKHARLGGLVKQRFMFGNSAQMKHDLRKNGNKNRSHFSGSPQIQSGLPITPPVRPIRVCPTTV
jgi:hypothetical protein